MQILLFPFFFIPPLFFRFHLLFFFFFIILLSISINAMQFQPTTNPVAQYTCLAALLSGSRLDPRPGPCLFCRSSNAIATNQFLTERAIPMRLIDVNIVLGGTLPKGPPNSWPIVLSFFGTDHLFCISHMTLPKFC
jgi:hypothetical protein